MPAGKPKKSSRTFGGGKMLWILDAGHGIETPGKRSPQIPPGIREYEFNRDIVKRVTMYLEVHNWPYHVVCQDEHTKKIRDRVAIANRKIDEWEGQAAFISVHANAAGPGGWYPRARGFRAFTKIDPKEPSKKLALFLGTSIHRTNGFIVGGPKDHLRRKGKRVPVGVLKNVRCPAVLIENGFMTSKEDCKTLSSDRGRHDIARGIFHGMMKYERWLNAGR